MSAGPTDDKATCIRSMELMATGTVDDFAEVYTADALDREADEHPPLRGPEGLHRTAERLRGAFSDMRWEVHEAVQDGDLVVLHTTMSGRQTGTMTAYVTSTGQLIGTLSSGRLEVSWPSNPGNVTVRSTNGGQATRTVTSSSSAWASS